MTDPNSPIYYGHKNVSELRGVYYTHLSPDKRWVELHFVSEPVVQLRVRERTESDPAIEKGAPDYWGWHGTDRPDHYSMVWPSKVQFKLCFPYGYEAEEARGRGRAVNLIVEEVS